MPTPTPKRPRGRPRLDPDNPSVPLNVRITPKQFDELCERARASRLELSDYVRRQLKHADMREPR